MEKFYFTYGSNHRDIYGHSLGRRYTVIEAESYWEARNKFVALRGLTWSFQYTEQEFSGQAEEYGLTEIPVEEVKHAR